MKKPLLLSADWVLPVESRPVRDGALLVQGDKIKAIGKRSFLEKKFPNASRRHFSKSAILPGFVNVHCHAAYTSKKFKQRTGPFAKWLKGMVAEHGKSPTSKKKITLSTRKGLKKLVESGVTTVADSAPGKAPLKALKESGLRGIFYQEILGFRESQPAKVPAKILKWHRRYQKKLPGRVQLGVAPHSPYTMPPDLLKSLTHCAVKEKIPVTLHVAESPEETLFFQKGDGALSEIYPNREKEIPRARSPVQYLEKLKVLGPHLLASHCVQINPSDLSLLKKRKVAVAHCPTSNLQLKVGKAPVKKFLKKKLPVGLGTDGLSSVPKFDFFQLMRDAVKVNRISSEKVLEMATLGGAKSLHLQKETGSLKKGKKADLIAVRLSGKRQKQALSPVHQLVMHSRPKDVRFSMADGKIILKK